jgi:hypothetical protein
MRDIFSNQSHALPLNVRLLILELGSDILRLYTFLTVQRFDVVGEVFTLVEQSQNLWVYFLERGIGGGDWADIDSLDLAGFGLLAKLFDHEGQLLCGIFDNFNYFLK